MPARPTRPIRYLAAPYPKSALAQGVLPVATVIETIGDALTGDAVVVADAGNIGAAAIHHLPFGPKQRFAVALGMGGMGYGIAAGIGRAIEHVVTGGGPRTVVLAGDGSFLMHGMEIHTAVEYNAPVTLVVANNNAHGMCVVRDRLYFALEDSRNRFRDSDIAAGLDAMFPGLAVAHPSDQPALRAACAEAFAASGPNCIVVDIDPDEIPPFAPFLPKGPL